MTYSRHSAYRQASATAWTRIDMLLALYDAALVAVEQGRCAAQEQNTAALIDIRFRAQRLIAELMAGVDTEQGDVPRNVHRLLAYSLTQICGSSAPEWVSASNVLARLRESFQAIRDEAVQLEQSGRIPPLELGSPELMVAVG